MNAIDPKRKLLAEFAGVFAIVALGYGSIAAAASGAWEPGPYGVSAVFGVVVALAIQLLAPYSVHFNPGVTVALGMMRWHSWREVWPFIAVQCAAALAAMAAIHAVFPAVDRFGAPSAPAGWLIAIAKEIGFMVPFIVLCMVAGIYFTKWRAVAIGAMVFSIGAVFGRFAGDLSMNPACTLATNLMEGNLEVLPAYALGTTIGCYFGFRSFARLRPLLDRHLASPLNAP
jgi:glycerol uptake facilitator-like aquaporin